jgi:hypothetical protein
MAGCECDDYATSSLDVSGSVKSNFLIFSGLPTCQYRPAARAQGMIEVIDLFMKSIS